MKLLSIAVGVRLRNYGEQKHVKCFEITLFRPLYLKLFFFNKVLK